MSRRVLKWQVPVDDRDYQIGSGPVLLIGCQDDQEHGVVQVWTDEASAEAVKLRPVRVYGTGHPVPEFAEAIGSVITGPFVWHVFAFAPVSATLTGATS